MPSALGTLSKLTPRRLAKWTYYRMLDRANRRLQRELPLVVHGGPFKGMKYIDESAGSILMPKLLGTYEQALQPALERVLQRKPGLVIDVGCAEGYYAVGFAHRLPEARVLAYDIDDRARELCSRLAQANGLEGQVEIRCMCDHGELNSVDLSNACVVSDCEAFEGELLDPEVVPGLKSAILVVEVHDCIKEGIGNSLRERFSQTHDLEEFEIQPPTGVEELLKNYPRYLHAGLAGEYRPAGNFFLVGTPKRRPGSVGP